ncbi:MAG: sodium-translocating pyrophosphatase [Candidatus ainarchaeum sp.]|nr:sodium-translocating pyrophosphatase [Candidatus ainarchaeum sp.]
MIDAVLAAIGAGIFVLIYAAYLVYSILKAPQGSEKMQEIAKAIQEGADAFLKRQYTTLAPLAIILALVIGYFIGWQTGAAFSVGVLSSALAGYVGMMVSVRANVRVAEGAKQGFARALALAFNGGAVTGMALMGLGLVAVSGLYAIFGVIPLIGFGFGASLISLFARVGGGIYTKAADVGADLVGKVEKGIPEDDPRNPAVIADNVGDNVGDCAGMAADVFESFVVTVIAAILLGSAPGMPAEYASYPLLLAAIGGVASVFGSFFVSVNDKKIMNAFYKGIIATALLMALGVYFAIARMELFLSALVGIAVTVCMFLISEYYTAKEHKPVQSVATAAKTGAGTNLIQGLAVGMESTGLPALLIIFAIAISFKLAGIYGIAFAAAAMLSLSGIVIAIDSYGPITDNAGGIAEMSGLSGKVREVTDELDAVGNTTKATTKGFAIAGAALGALALFSAFAADAKITSVDLLQPAVTIGLFIGALLPFIFSSMLMTAVGRAAFFIVEEVRRQFREIKGLMEGKAKPDYARAVDISTKTALGELLVPGMLAVFTPLVVGLLLGAEALAGLLAGAIASGFLMALFMSTSGAAWDNAKKYIEMGNFGGKGSDTHKAAVVGDTLGDPFKDTAGPALNALIKVVNTVSLVFVALILKYGIKLI